MSCHVSRVMRHRQLQEPEVIAADDADTRRRDEMSDEEEEEELDEEVCLSRITNENFLVLLLCTFPLHSVESLCEIESKTVVKCL